MTKKAFIFDLDGVIVDTARYHFLAWRKIAEHVGIEFTPEHNERLKGVSRVRSLDIILEIGNISASDGQKQTWLHQKNQDYLLYVSDMTPADILPGVKPVLQFLRAHGQPIALGSASKNAKLILDKVGLTAHFDAIVDGNQVTNAKPDPEVFLQAAAALSMNPEDAIVFEDAIAGIEAANNAQMVSVGIGEKTTLSHADYVFSDFNQIDLSFLETLIRK